MMLFNDRFDEFWKVWPRKKNVSKAKARELWKKNGCDEVADLIIAAVINLKKTDWLEIEEKFIPHPTTYLNQKRWETADEVSMKTPDAPKYTKADLERWSQMPFSQLETYQKKALGAIFMMGVGWCPPSRATIQRKIAEMI